MTTTPSPARRGDAECIILDGSQGEGGGQILRTALSLSLLTGRAFRMVNIRANRQQPGLRPQHLQAVLAAATLGLAKAEGAKVGARELTFFPSEYEARDLAIDIGTAGSTGLVLQTLHLPLALRARTPARLNLTGGTFNPKAPAFPFLDTTWCAYLSEFHTPVVLAMPRAGFYPRGGGQVDAWIKPAPTPRAFRRISRGQLRQVHGIAGVANLQDDIARRMANRAIERLEAHGLTANIDRVRWPSPGQGAALCLSAEYAGIIDATFVGLGQRGKPSQAVADEAVDQLLAFDAVKDAAVDPHSADQILLPLAFAAGGSEFSVSAVTEHLRTNARTIRAFLERSITILEPQSDKEPGRVVIE
jgi:RNA 3'-terminal phosphate cyclase (ATP)